MGTSDRSAEHRAEDWPRLIIEAAPNAMLMVDGRREITLVNRGTEALFGYSRNELVGRLVESLVPERFRPGLPALVAGFLQHPEQWSLSAGRELFGLHKDGRELPIDVGLSPIETPEGFCLLASVVDRSERLRAEERFRTVVEAAPNAMLMVDRQRRIVLLNRAAEALFGYSRQELVGQPLDLLVPARFRGAHAQHVTGFFAEASTRAMGAGRELFGLRKDGSEVPIEIGLNPLTTPEGPATLASIIDVTQRRLIDDELRRSNQNLEQFAYVASHDLQEPLRMIRSYTELLADRYKGKLDERADKYIHFASDGARRMQLLISDLLAYSRVGSQSMPLVPVATEQALRNVLDVLRVAIRRAGARVEHGALPWVMADEGQLEQLLQNLIGNALKFRGASSPLIEIGATLVGERYLFHVRDNGIGIAPQHTERIFQMFQRLNERGKYEGSGIGLALAKRIVERHGGEIWVESTPERGSTFYFSLAPSLPSQPA